MNGIPRETKRQPLKEGSRMRDDANGPRIEHGDYIAEVLRANGPDPFWYYVLQRKGSSEILDLMKFEKYEDASEGARRALARLHRAAAAD